MKIVISGGLGYIGGRMSKYFAERGHEVVALSRQAGNLDNIKFSARMKAVHPEAALADTTVIKGADAFIHLAAMNEHDCVKYPEKAIEVNITGALRWLDAAHQALIPRFMYFSTAHVYGKPLEGFYDENSLTHPIHPYAITHKCAEDYVLAFAAEKGMVNTVIRLTNAFGGPAFPTADRWTLLVNDLCQSAVKTGKMTLLSDGLQQRDFICIEDVCEAALHLLNLPSEKAYCQIYNLGAAHSVSVFDMALKVKIVAEDVLGRKLQLERKRPSGTVSTEQLTISIDKLLRTGYHLKNKLEDEIESTVEFFNKYTHGN